MTQTIAKWVSKRYQRIVTSIAFLPALMAISFSIISYLAVQFDFSDQGRELKSRLHWLSLKDASTARSICSVITSGVISLTVFSFSMVMILLNQAASQMTNRILGRLIGNRFQQIVLGFYIGTIVYGLFLLSTIRDVDSGVYVPALSTYFLIALTILDIFLFIYFLHYVTTSVKYDTIITGIYNNTLRLLSESMLEKTAFTRVAEQAEWTIVGKAAEAGFFLGFNKKPLMDLCSKHDTCVRFLHPAGMYLLEGTALYSLSSSHPITPELIEKMDLCIISGKSQEESEHYNYGFQQLMEISVKALSPGINDPETAVIGIHALCNLLAYLFEHKFDPIVFDEGKKARIIICHDSYEKIIDRYLYPIWDYGKHDRVIQSEIINMVPQLIAKLDLPVLHALLTSAKTERSKLLRGD